MQAPARSNSRKRRRSGQCPLDTDGEAFQTTSKKLKAIHTPQPATHQEKPSPIPLERAALKALRQQNAQAAREIRVNQRTRRPVTRLFLPQWQIRHQPLEPAGTYLENCGHKQYRALESFAKDGGPDLGDLRGCQRAALRTSKYPMAPSQASSTSRSRGRRSSRTKPTTEDGTSKSLSAYNRAFQQVLVDYNVFPAHYKHSDGRVAPKPDNWDYINERLTRPRPSLSPSKYSQGQHDSFVELDASAAKESQVKKNVIPIIEGTIKDPRTTSGEIPFTNLTPLVADENLVSGNPDFYRGARPEDLKREVRKDLQHTIVPSTQQDLPILPNHFTAAKGPDGTAAVAGRQATYDAFFGARAMHAIQNYGRAEPRFDNKAYTISNIYNNGMLKVHTSHPVKPNAPGEQPSYYINSVRSFSMVDTAATWITGATYYRNSLDLAEEWRNEAISGANEVVANRARGSPVASINTGASFALDSLTMESQNEPAPSVSSEDFETAASSQGEGEEEEEEEEDKEEARLSPPVPAKRSRSCAQIDSRKRRTRDDSEGNEGTGIR